MKQATRKTSHGLTAFACVLFANALYAQIGIPQPAPYVNDANTVLLEHFDGTTSGSASSPISYDQGVLGQGVRLNEAQKVEWNFGALQQGTVEFWVNLDNVTNSGPNYLHMVSSHYAGIPGASTLYVNVDKPETGHTNIVQAGVNIAPFNWNGLDDFLPNVMQSNCWTHLALTWGSQGLRVYINGSLVGSNSNTGGQNPSTAVWGIGDIEDNSSGFNGLMDELRISNIQRDFIQVPEPTTWSLLALGVVALLVGLRLRRPSS